MNEGLTSDGKQHAYDDGRRSPPLIRAPELLESQKFDTKTIHFLNSPFARRHPLLLFFNFPRLPITFNSLSAGTARQSRCPSLPANSQKKSF